MYPEHDIKNKLRIQTQGTKMDGGYMGKEKVAGKGNLFTTMGKVLLVMYILTGILLFILADGWNLVIGSVVKTFY